MISLMDPGVLVADVGHVKEVLVQPGLADSLLKKRFMGSGGTGGHDHPVDPLFLDDILHLFLGILGAGEKIILYMDHMGEGSGIFPDSRNISHPADIDTAVTDKNPHPNILSTNVRFGRQFLLPDQRPPGLG